MIELFSSKSVLPVSGFIVDVRSLLHLYLYAMDMPVSAVTIKEICNNVLLARENSLLGNYEDSEVFYEGSLQKIHQLVLVVPDVTRKNKWEQVCSSFLS